MNKRSILALVLLLSLSLCVTACNPDAASTATNGNGEETGTGQTTAGEDQTDDDDDLGYTITDTGRVLDVKIGLSLQSSLAKGVSFENVEVQVGISPMPQDFPWDISNYNTGGPCIYLLGDVNNSTGEDLIIIMSATGYNPDWEAASHTLSSSRIAGVAEFFVPRQSVESFEIMLSWAEDLRYLEIGAVSIDEAHYYGPGDAEE